MPILLKMNAKRTRAALASLAREPAALRGLGPTYDEEAAEIAGQVAELEERDA